MYRKLLITIGISIPVVVLILMFILGWFSPGASQTNGDSFASIEEIPVPTGFRRIDYDTNSFPAWIRKIPFKPPGTPVVTYSGMRWYDQRRHYAVIDIDIGDRDLQQCADVIMRLRSEYLYQRERLDSISFNFTSGDTASFRDWINGIRPVVNGNKVAWKNTGTVDSSQENLEAYLDVIYTYCGTYSLSHQLPQKDNFNSIEPGDIFVEGGFPGHAVMIADAAINPETGERVYLILQGFTPAQNIHIMVNPNDRNISPWYRIRAGRSLETTDWTFTPEHLREF